MFKTIPHFALLLSALALPGAGSVAAERTAQEQAVPVSCKLDRAKLPGYQVKLSAIAIGFNGEHEKKLKMAIEELELAGKNGVDAACLPEEFAGTRAEPIPGPTTKAIAELARKYSMYVICPIREQAGNEQFNTAVLLDRQGQIAGYYRKVFVFWGEGLNVSREGVKTFDTDFGKVGILTCFDANFPELWQECNSQKADVVFWPSAYGGGEPLNAYSALYHYCIVAVGWGDIIDPISGKALESCQKVSAHQFVATVDLDATLVHKDFTDAKIARLIKEHKGEVALDERFNTQLNRENWYLLKALKPGVRVRELLKQYNIEPLRDYQLRSRKEINEIRAKGGKV